MKKIDRIFADTHIHTETSGDSNSDALGICKQAVKKGISILTFTDHVDVNWPKRSPELRAQQTKKLVDEMNEKFSELKVLYGAELGQIPQNTSLAAKITRDQDFDYVIASMHNTAGYEDFSILDYYDKNLDMPALFLAHYEEMLSLVRAADFDSLAHITYTFRYLSNYPKTQIKLDDYFDIFDEIFKALIDRNKALEINTSGLRQTIGETLPGERLLKRYRELGGELITIGSDAHINSDVGAGVLETYDFAKELGFKFTAYYDSRKPSLIKL